MNTLRRAMNALGDTPRRRVWSIAQGMIVFGATYALQQVTFYLMRSESRAAQVAGMLGVSLLVGAAVVLTVGSINRVTVWRAALEQERARLVDKVGEVEDALDDVREMAARVEQQAARLAREQATVENLLSMTQGKLDKSTGILETLQDWNTLQGDTDNLHGRIEALERELSAERARLQPGGPKRPGRPARVPDLPIIRQDTGAILARNIPEWQALQAQLIAAQGRGELRQMCKDLGIPHTSGRRWASWASEDAQGEASDNGGGRDH